MCCGSDAPPPPDYSALAASNERAAAYAKQIADADLAFRKGQWAAAQPMLQRAAAMSERVANSQLMDAAAARERGAVAWDDWNQLGRPLQDRVVGEANAYGGAADQAMQAGRAIADVNAQGANARAQGARAMAAMGVNPNSGRFAAMNRSADLSQAAMAAGAATNARTMARDKGMALRAGALAGMTGQQNVAGQNLGAGVGAGNAAVGNMNAGANNGLGWAGYASGGVGNAINAGQLRVQGNSSIGQMMANTYGTQMQGWAQGGTDLSGLGAIAAMGARAYGIPMADGGMVRGPGTGTSDDVQAVNEDTGHPVRLSNGEYVLPADTVRAIGKRALDRIVAKTHTPVRRAVGG